MKREPAGDDLVAIVAAYVIVMRERRTLAAVPAPAPVSNWRRAARREAVGETRAPWRASIEP